VKNRVLINWDFVQEIEERRSSSGVVPSMRRERAEKIVDDIIGDLMTLMGPNPQWNLRDEVRTRWIALVENTGKDDRYCSKCSAPSWIHENDRCPEWMLKAIFGSPARP